MVKGLKLFCALVCAALVTLVINSCSPKDYSRLPALSGHNHFRAVIEVPAGSNLKVNYCRLTFRFRVESAEGEEKKIPYLASPVNIGFIPSTRIAAAEEKGKLIEVMVIAERMETGTVTEVVPLGLIVIKDAFRTDYKILSIPADSTSRIVDAQTFQALQERYPGLTGILETWLINSGNYKNPVVLGWEDEHTAANFIEKWIED